MTALPSFLLEPPRESGGQRAPALGEPADAAKLAVARSFGRRLRGLLFTKAGSGQLLILKCHDVHSFGMRYPIDIAFVDEGGLVLKVYRAVEPGGRLRCKGACAVVERIATPGAWLEPGDFAGEQVAYELDERRFL